VSTDNVRAGVKHDASKDETDGVVGVTEDGDEVGHEVDGERQVGDEQEQPDANATSDVLE
jgi:hypothetical protein